MEQATFIRYDDPPPPLPQEPERQALRAACAVLVEARGALQVQLRRAEEEADVAARERRFADYVHGSPAHLRRRIHDMTHVIDWLGYRADMREVW